MRLLPRWVRAFLILLTVQVNIILISVFLNLTLMIDTDGYLFYESQSCLLVVGVSSLFSYLMLYGSTRFINVSVGSVISSAKSSDEVLKKL